MNKIYIILTSMLLALCLQANTSINTYEESLLSFSNPTNESQHQADSIMQYVIKYATQYANAIKEYQAEIYIKGRTEILKQNFLIQYAHHIFPIDKKKNNIIFEMVSESEYDAPNLYFHDFKAINGNTIPNRKKQQEILTFLNLNIYSPTIYNETIITPVGKKAFNYYEYNLEEIITIDGQKVYKIRFLPKQWSQKFVNGDLYICENDWRIEKIDMSGWYEFCKFNLKMTFGDTYRNLILPSKADLLIRYNILGNLIETTYHSSFNYHDVKWEYYKERLRKGKRQWKSLDLTKYYTLASDSIPIIQDETYWEEKRDIPLTNDEVETYNINYHPSKREKKDSVETNNYFKITEKLTNNINYDFRSTNIRYSGLLNPLQLGYSSRDGITYKQQVRITKSFKNDKQIILSPEVGYLFKRKELFFKLRASWNYLPEKRGNIRLTIANDNQSYSSQMIQEITEHLKDSIFDFNDLNLKYYRHYYIDLRNNIELSNGFMFAMGVSYHRRFPVKSKLVVNPGYEIESLINETYYDFSPEIGITYTPRQFYRMNGKKKEYVYSYYPTISLIISRGVPGFLNSSGDYGRVEADIHQSFKLNSIKRLNYHISGGKYTRKKSTYFAEFQYFARRNFPQSWDDGIGGVFHTLRREWFNASDKYIQAQIMYESPFILMNLFSKKASRYVMSERLYAGQLWTPALPCYTEIGYGLGNQLFNIAIFAGFDKFKYNELAVKFTFELE